MAHSTAHPNITGLSDADALIRIGLLIDESFDTKSSRGTDQACVLLDEFAARNPSPDLVALSHYLRANTWANREQIGKNQDVWAWEQPECQEQILALRRAIRHEGFSQLPAVRQCQILTNLANQLDKIGRFIEAVEYYDRVLSLRRQFGMARGNRGIALSHYGRALYDGDHTRFMLVTAHEALTASLARDAWYESPDYKHAQAGFMEEARKIEKLIDVASARQRTVGKEYKLGKSAEERRYRSWCLKNRLFMNPLNDLGSLPIAVRDTLILPSLTVGIASGGLVPAVLGFFNQIKQEFVSARYLYYEGLRAKGPHFSDRAVLLYNTLDYPVYSLAAEKIRLVARSAYSLFDKISSFLNHYLALGHKPDRVSFRNVWYEAKGKSPPLLPVFSSCPNWPLRGLFWLSKDLFEPEFQNVTEPDAESLNEIRNYLEHKYLQVHQEIVASGPQSLAYSIYRQDLEVKTLRLLKLARAALIYLCLAMWSEERRRNQGSRRKLAISLPLDVWRDEWKQ